MAIDHQIPNEPSWRYPTKNLAVKAAGLVISAVLMMFLSFRWTRMIHIISGFVWYAMLIFLVVIFLPVADRFSEDALYENIGLLIPRIFHTVTVAGFYTVTIGWYNAFYLANGRWSYFYKSPISILFTVSIVVVTLMYCFHLFLESSEINVSSKVARGDIDPSSPEYQLLLKGIQITPRVGIIIITIAIVVMFVHN